jgi:hypothetical protein
MVSLRRSYLIRGGGYLAHAKVSGEIRFDYLLRRATQCLEDDGGAEYSEAGCRINNATAQIDERLLNGRRC